MVRMWYFNGQNVAFQWSGCGILIVGMSYFHCENVNFNGRMSYLNGQNVII